MNKYQVSFVVEAQGQNDAFDKLAEQIGKQPDLNKLSSSIKEYEEQISWYKYAEDCAKDALDSYNIGEKVDEKVTKFLEDYLEVKEPNFDPQEEADTIYDDLYQEEDLYSTANEMADGRFIYFHNKGLMEAFDCLDDLGEFEADDSGLWEGEKNPRQIILIQATYTLAGAIMHYLEEQIKVRASGQLQEWLDKKGE